VIFRLASALALLGLSGCVSPGPDKAALATVYIPVATPCSASAGPAPAYVDGGREVSSASDVFAVAKLRMAARQQALEYISRLEAANKACALTR
jgi:hypothetical protein